MKRKEVVLRGRQAIADYFKVSRMTLYRWEKILPLPTEGFHLHYYDISIDISVLKSWVEDLDEKIRRVRKRCRYNHYLITTG